MTIVLRLEQRAPDAMVLAFGLYGIEHFHACVLATRFPEHVYTGEYIDDAVEVIFVAESFMSCLSDIVHHIHSGRRMVELDPSVRQSFLHLLADFGRKQSDWNKKIQAPLLQRILDALAKLVTVRIHPEVDKQITILRTRYEYITGPESIKTLDAEVQEIVRHKAATVIQRRWSLEFKFNTLAQLARNIRERGISVCQLRAMSFEQTAAVLNNREAVDFTSALLLRVRCMLEPKGRRIPPMPRSLRRIAIYTRTFLSVFMIHFYPNEAINSYLGDDSFKELCHSITEASENLVEYFEYAMAQIRVTGTLDRPRDFMVFVENYVQTFKKWRTQDKAVSVDFYEKHLEEYTIQLTNLPPTSRLRIPLIEKITKARQRIILFAGPGRLGALERRLSTEQNRSTSANRIARAWRNHLHLRSMKRVTIQNIINNPVEDDGVEEVGRNPDSFEVQQQEMNNDFIDRMLDLKIRANFTLPQEHPGAFTSFIKQTHAFIHQNRSHRTPWGKGNDTLCAQDAEWAALHVNVFPADDEDPKVMDTSFARSVVSNGNFSFKPQEIVFKPSKYYGMSILNLGMDYPQFRNSRIVLHHSIGHTTASLVETQFSLHLLITNAPGCKGVSVLNSNNTVMITCTKDELSIPSIGIAIIEVQHCALCGEQATQKCSTCWRNHRLCIRYCSKECTIRDRNRHSAVCGGDLSDDWHGATF